MVTITCVLRSEKWDNRGKVVEYQPEHVLWLKRQVEKHVTVPYRFVCLSDLKFEGVEIIPLNYTWAGWWAKIELFRPGLFDGRVFYLDLDTVIVRNIDDMVDARYKHFTALRNLSGHKSIGSGVMAWRGFHDFSFIYENFRKEPAKFMSIYQTSSKWGDQGFIGDQLVQAGIQREYFQALFPGAVKSYKFDLNQGDPDAGTKIVCFHGLPKPFDVKKEWIPQ
jgi:alpha-N-acetylglucosamine transferase